MKKQTSFIIIIVVALFTACEQKIRETITYKINEPIYMPAAEFRKSITTKNEPRDISNQGKICFYNNFLFISEKGKGIHIVDNNNPENPQNIGFIELLGCMDLAIRNNLLYADSFIDLVWFNIDTPASPTFEGRLENAFPQALPPTENDYGIDYSKIYGEEEKGIVVGWELKERTEEIEYYYRNPWWEPEFIKGDSGNSGSASIGINGSMSRFSIYKDYLYTVIDNYMNIFNLADNIPSLASEKIFIGHNVETIFSYKDNMFMGTPNGMLIYSVTEAVNPTYQSMIWHVYGCDPVVVENDLAYVTVHSGNFCGQNDNELLVVDVSDVKNPKQLVSYTMTKPKGLSIDNSILFVCDDGLKIYKADDPQTIMANRLAHYSGMEGYDVIAYNNVLMMIADDGLYQYDYSDINNIKPISKLSLYKK